MNNKLPKNKEQINATRKTGTKGKPYFTNTCFLYFLSDSISSLLSPCMLGIIILSFVFIGAIIQSPSVSLFGDIFLIMLTLSAVLTKR